MIKTRGRVAAGFVGTLVIAGALAACAGLVVVPVGSAGISSDGMTLDLNYNACTTISGPAVQEFASAVEVYLLADRPAPSNGSDCQGHVVAELKAPLGDRVLKDPYTGKVIPVSTSG